MNRQHLIDHMAIVLCDEPEIGDDSACVRRLLRGGFTPQQITLHLETARARARRARTAEAELWITTLFK